MGSGNNNGNWASDDDANDLLAGILDETEEDARSEEERLQAQLEQKRAEQEAREKRARQRKRAEAKARITAEEQRLEGLEKRRTLRQEALRIEELKERGEYVEEKPQPESAGPAETEPRGQEPGQQRHDKPRKEQARPYADLRETQPSDIVDTTSTGSSKLPVIALAAVFALVAGAAAMAFMLSVGDYQPDASIYSKSVYEPRETRDMQVSVGFTPIREDEETAETPRVRPDPTPVRRPPTSNNTSVSDDSSDESDETTSPTLPDFDESGFDPFGEGP